jgi:hypothetical protein
MHIQYSRLNTGRISVGNHELEPLAVSIGERFDLIELVKQVQFLLQ